MPPRASLMVAVYFERGDPDINAIVESDQSLLVECGVSVTRGIVRFQERKPHVLVTNVMQKYQHFNNWPATAFREEMREASDVTVVTDFERQPDNAPDNHIFFYVNLAQLHENEKKLMA